MTQQMTLKMIKRRRREAGLPTEITNHSFLGTGITEYLRIRGDLDTAARIAGHESTRPTQLYHCVHEELSLDEIEQIHVQLPVSFHIDSSGAFSERSRNRMRSSR